MKRKIFVEGPLVIENSAMTLNTALFRQTYLLIGTSDGNTN